MPKLRKAHVTKGVYWIEVPEAQVYVLCGCPADAVKHLMKHGLIQTRKEKGTAFETGPNVILLSDILVQNGKFANLAEFPVLQMLYRQGMILPDHPNNTGIKPMIIGSEDQVEAQMQYIYRGNYGLVSEEEIINTGVSPEIAREFMAVKLKFTFGEILTTDKLLDTLIVKTVPVEIRNEVFVRHLRMNVFEFQYQGEFATVNLNLTDRESYHAPYTLGYHNIKREYFSVIHSGQGDGWDVNRPAMSSILMFQGKIYLIDVGPHILNSLLSLGISVNEIEGIFHTHAHDDHFAGITTLMRADHRIKYYSTPLVRASIIKKLSVLLSIEENAFFDYFEVCDMEFDVWTDLEGLEVIPIYSPHPVETNMFVFRAMCGSGYKSYAHFADIVALDILEDMIADNGPQTGISQEFFNTVKRNYLQSAHLKKIDIGGGLVHGDAEDFREDVSEKIILSHTSLGLTQQQKQIGSGASFGIADVLIPAYQDYARRNAFQYLRSYFPTVALYKIKVLLNNSAATFNPETIILKSGMTHKEIFLILTGNVEQIYSDTDRPSILSAGAMIGEISGLKEMPSTETYRAISFVHALQLPNRLYLEFVKQNDLYANIERLQERRGFLLRTWLFGYTISYTKQNEIAQSMVLHQYPEGKVFPENDNSNLNLVCRGKLQIFIGDNASETLSAGHFFGEEGVLFETSSILQMRAMEPSEIYQIPSKLLLDIPIIRWKLLEVFKKRREYLLIPDFKDNPIFYWRDDYSINVKEMDDHHKKLFERANKLSEAISINEEKSALEDALNFLIDYAEYHFSEEENLLKQHGYTNYESHREKHETLMSEILELKEKINKNYKEMDIEVLIDFFKHWIIEHILTEDRKYGPFLNSKGVF